jgi:hypothetical protein
MNSFGPRIGLITSPGMALRLKKLNRSALVVHWFSEQGPKVRTLFTMFLDNPMRVDICFQSSSDFLMVRDMR